MTTNSNIDCINNNFEFKTLTKIDDVPTYKNLTTIKKLLMANANKVPSDLEGGTNGHLGLVLSATDYALISNIPYVRTPYSGPMPAVDPANLPGIVIAREEFKDNTKLFREANGVEDALLTQLNQALPPLYLEHYRDINSQKITTRLQIILQELFDTYGEISDEQVKEEEAELKKKVKLKSYNFVFG